MRPTTVNNNNLKNQPIPVVPITMRIVNPDGTPTRQGQLLLEQLQQVGVTTPGGLPPSETPAGTIDGTNTVFTLEGTPAAGILLLFLNGVEQLKGTDYFLSGNTITYQFAPQPGDWQDAYYVAGTDTGSPAPPTGNPETVTFSISTAHELGSGISCIGSITCNLSVDSTLTLVIQNDDFVWDTTAWTQRTNTETLDYDPATGLVTVVAFGGGSGGNRTSTLQDFVVTIYSASTLVQSGSPGDKMLVYDCWMDLTYPDGSTATMRPSDAFIIPQPTHGTVTNIANAVDGNMTTYATVERTSSSPTGGAPGLQITNFSLHPGRPGYSQRGNIAYDQIRAVARQGPGSQFQMFGGGPTAAGDLAVFDANGNVVDGGAGGGGGSLIFAGDLSGTSLTQTVVGLQGRPISTTAPADTQVLTWVAADSKWEPKPAAGGGGGTSAAYVTETPAGALNGTNTTFTLTYTPVAGSLGLYLNGVQQVPTTDYTVSGTTLTYGVAPKATDFMTAMYTH